MAQRLRALADPTRLRILEVLAGGEHCVCEIRAHFDRLPANLLSHHLRVLREAELVESEKRGRWVHYRLREGALADLCEALTRPRAPHAKVCACQREGGPQRQLRFGSAR